MRERVKAFQPRMPRRKKDAPDDGVTQATRKMQFLRTLRCTLKYERLARLKGATIIAGVDEVGRGALFGPVVAAAVILPEEFRLRGLRDSKQLLAEQRESMDKVIRAKAICFAIAAVDAETIDRINIYQASRMAMLLAVKQLATEPDHLLIDALRLDTDCAQTKLFYGDSLSVSIAAASVIAKVHRDALVSAMDADFPHYNLKSNKGYGTPDHRRALKEHGPCALHRRSFAPVCGDAEAELPFDEFLGDELGGDLGELGDAPVEAVFGPILSPDGLPPAGEALADSPAISDSFLG